MIEVILYRNDKVEARVFDIETPEDAIFVARTLYDDSLRAFSCWGAHKTIRIVFLVDDVFVRMLEGKRP